MIVIRNVFHLKFGKAREAMAIMKDGLALQKRLVPEFSPRLLTDVTGQFYTLVLEHTTANLSAFETAAPKIMGNKEWEANYQKLVPLVESGHREVFSVVE
jgi:hypothetical protein